jgi:hypothetical protein
MDINTVANVGTLVAVASALVFGAIQVSHAQRKARNQATWDILSSFLDPDVRRGYPLVRDLPDDCDPEEIRLHPDVRYAAETMDFLFEGHGMMVDRRAVSLREFDALLGGSCRMCWRKLRRYVLEERQRTGNPHYGEWFEWLVGRIGPEKGRPGRA